MVPRHRVGLGTRAQISRGAACFLPSSRRNGPASVQPEPDPAALSSGAAAKNCPQPKTVPSHLPHATEAVPANPRRAVRAGFVFLPGYITGVRNAVKAAQKGPVFERLSSGFY